MNLHLWTGSVPVEVHVHGEFGATERVTVTPRSDAPAIAAPAPARARARRWPWAAIPVVAVLAGFVGHKIGSTATVEETRRLAAYRSLSQPEPGPVRGLDAPILRTIPQADTLPTTTAGVPAGVAQMLAQPWTVTLPRGVPDPSPPQPSAPSGRNPFGLD